MKRNLQILSIGLLTILVLAGFISIASSQTLSQTTYVPVLLRDFAPTFTPTPTPTSTPPPQTTGNVQIASIFVDGAGSTEPDEYVAIRNDESFAIQLQNWTLRDIANHIFSFPPFVIQPGQTCRVYTNQSHPEWCNFNYGSSSAIWNNDGDCAYLRNALGTQIDSLCY